ncbi:hypothetical protein F511_25555 [Dorcoceras hygrometricum]|uniref:Uncharacterized protein n=1 Tax=Dorcoceras hygrometricum TaxID=472368 RepID=A0A2Z7C8A2_9LAMI|nr:hypothetical protein F511_25555 [Dorcoceras hygrometricum]
MPPRRGRGRTTRRTEEESRAGSDDDIVRVDAQLANLWRVGFRSELFGTLVLVIVAQKLSCCVCETRTFCCSDVDRDRTSYLSVRPPPSSKASRRRCRFPRATAALRRLPPRDRTCFDHRDEEFPSVLNFSVLLVQADEGIVFPIGALIADLPPPTV